MAVAATSSLALGAVSSLGAVNARLSSRVENVGGEKAHLGSKFEALSLKCGAVRRSNGSFQVVAQAQAAAAAAEVAEERTNTANPVSRLKSIYLEKVVPAMKEEFKYTNSMEVPYLKKIVVNCGVGEAAQNAKSLESTIRDLSLITGQRPVTTRAKKAIAGFKLREGVPVGVYLTLRGEVMYSFLDRLMNLALPRTRDFQGVNAYSFDGKGNYTLGLPEQSVFPEIRFENIDKERGMDVCIMTTAKNDAEGQKLLSLLGMPFKDSVGGRSASSVKKKAKNMYKTGKRR
ncbi:large subunit ribosomal protein L5 [Marchantia polymorpha subsp. ruderalis]|uniref:Large ribosomal subunit protein uL5c n=2 Tax=Marchantia polymorpha TaxID=3197 RepID=A0A176VLP2_MARPO|nr:hypothetical protein AXG93_3256s1100 [Marchantia polymorpha subsp. ruderalis]PTQ50340.1 hypothetical protein MARPO_0001s0334 [Marchantia polymorpha]BBM99258.1 hypothetical protein Mp_1g19970 [Marchantia polymorpha subsp. ruderalis]|eukprot:PTQ50340.1 hypothetical protein MARPO_0001s0334 [Marchantia polymorpha]